jgi:S1-C subfamily serine protease
VQEVNGQAPKGFVDFTKSILAAKDERELSIVVRRDGQQKTLKLKLVAEKSFFNSDLVRRKIGASVQDLTPDLARAMGVPGYQGVLIGDVERDSPADNANLEPGMIVTSIDRQATPDVVVAARTLYAKAKGDKARLGLIVAYRRGAFLRLSEAAAEVTVR